MNRGRLQFSAAACIWMAFLLLILPLRWLAAAIIAAVFHELCHLGAIYLCGGQVRRLFIEGHGARIEIPEMSRGKELLCALAGPAGGFVLMFFGRWLPRIALCAGMQSIYNLLPLYPLDGGRALRCLTALLLSPKLAESVCVWTERLTVGCIFFLAAYGSVAWGLGLFPMILSAVLYLRIRCRKTPCKPAVQAVQ